MITRAVLEAKRGLYVKGREQAMAQVSAFNGAIESIDDLLSLVDQAEAAQTDNTAAIEAAEENTNG